MLAACSSRHLSVTCVIQLNVSLPQRQPYTARLCWDLNRGWPNLRAQAPPSQPCLISSLKLSLPTPPSLCPVTETSAAPFPREQIPSWLERSWDNVGRQFKQLRQNTPVLFTLCHYYTFQPQQDWLLSGISSLLQLFPTCNWFCGTQREGG